MQNTNNKTTEFVQDKFQMTIIIFDPENSMKILQFANKNLEK